MRADLHVCSAWESNHERPVYTLADTCPECGADAVNSAPAPFSPEDPNGKYRRALKRRSPE
jgi:H/ACA ribonucleoprotein complex subunit 3